MCADEMDQAGIYVMDVSDQYWPQHFHHWSVFSPRDIHLVK